MAPTGSEAQDTQTDQSHRSRLGDRSHFPTVVRNRVSRKRADADRTGGAVRQERRRGTAAQEVLISAGAHDRRVERTLAEVVELGSGGGRGAAVIEEHAGP